MNLYNRIEKLCFDHNINITDMCRECGASRGSLGDLKSGKKKVLSVDTLLKISTYFGITINELISSGINRICAARRYRHKSSSEIADMLDIDIATYNHYEEAENAPLHILSKLSELLEVDIEFIKGTEYVLDNPVSSWSKDLRDDYNAADECVKLTFEYKYGKIRYLKSNIPGITIADNYEAELLRLFRICNVSDQFNIIATLKELSKKEEEKRMRQALQKMLDAHTGKVFSLDLVELYQKLHRIKMH